MSDLNPLAIARDHGSRATPYRLLQRVAGLAFNFSTVDVEAFSEKVVEVVAETGQPIGIEPAFVGT